MLNFVVALHSEAKPLIAHYKLKRLPADQSLRVYGKDDIRLVVSGPGMIAAAAATAYLRAAYRDSKTAVWLNVGIAGHHDRPLGHCMLAHKIIDTASGQTWYPQFAVSSALASGTLATHARVPDNYTDDHYDDMEGAAFFATASRFAPAEIVHCLKVVSDNRHDPKENVTPERANELITTCLPHIDDWTNRLRPLAREANARDEDPKGYAECMKRWRFSNYQSRQIYARLRAIQILQPRFEVESSAMFDIRDRGEAIAWLDAYHQSLPLRLDHPPTGGDA